MTRDFIILGALVAGLLALAIWLTVVADTLDKTSGTGATLQRIEQTLHREGAK